jgi:SNF2 family DNA or RNA helicase
LSVVLADEAHRLKEPRGKIGLAMKKLKCPSCFALTGTLIQNRLEEMWSVLDFVSISLSVAYARYNAVKLEL